MNTVHFVDKNRKPIVIGSIHRITTNDDYISCHLGSTSNGGAGTRDFYKYDVKYILNYTGNFIYLSDELSEYANLKSALLYLELSLEDKITDREKELIADCYKIIDKQIGEYNV